MATASRPAPVATLRAVSLHYGKTLALDGVDLEIRPGSWSA